MPFALRVASYLLITVVLALLAYSAWFATVWGVQPSLAISAIHSRTDTLRYRNLRTSVQRARETFDNLKNQIRLALRQFRVGFWLCCFSIHSFA
jgi:hypothetical protein